MSTLLSCPPVHPRDRADDPASPPLLEGKSVPIDEVGRDPEPARAFLDADALGGHGLLDGSRLLHAPQPHLNGKHTVFGKVTKGQDVVDAVRQGDSMIKVTVTEV